MNRKLKKQLLREYEQEMRFKDELESTKSQLAFKQARKHASQPLIITFSLVCASVLATAIILPLALGEEEKGNAGTPEHSTFLSAFNEDCECASKQETTIAHDSLEFHFSLEDDAVFLTPAYYASLVELYSLDEKGAVEFKFSKTENKYTPQTYKNEYSIKMIYKDSDIEFEELFTL